MNDFWKMEYGKIIKRGRSILNMRKISHIAFEDNVLLLWNCNFK